MQPYAQSLMFECSSTYAESYHLDPASVDTFPATGCGTSSSLTSSYGNAARQATAYLAKDLADQYSRTIAMTTQWGNDLADHCRFRGSDHVVEENTEHSYLPRPLSLPLGHDDTQSAAGFYLPQALDLDLDAPNTTFLPLTAYHDAHMMRDQSGLGLGLDPGPGLGQGLGLGQGQPFAATACAGLPLPLLPGIISVDQYNDLSMASVGEHYAETGDTCDDFSIANRQGAFGFLDRYPCGIGL
jgi:hypothetical protein